MRARPPGVGNSPLKSLYLGDLEPYVPPAEELVIPLNERKYIQTLTESCCRWPIGDPQQPEFHFCGKKKIPGLPYCEVHARRAFQPPQARRRERDFVPVPMVVLPGSAALFQERMKFVAATIPDGKGRLLLLPGLGHVPHIEAPEKTYPPLLAFLKEAS